MGRPKKKVPEKVTVDFFNACAMPGLIEQTRVSAEDIFKHGPWEETKDFWQMIALKIQTGEKLFEVETKYLTKALHEMCKTGDANGAFGVKRKGLFVKHIKATMYHVDSLQTQGMNREEAWSMVANLNWQRGVIGDISKDPGEALRKKITTAHKHIYGNVSRKKNR